MNDMRDRVRRLLGEQADRDRLVVIGLVVTGLWLALVAMFWLFGPDGTVPSGTARLVTIAGIVMPVALTWLAVGLARAIAALRAEADDLRAHLERMRGAAGDPGMGSDPAFAGRYPQDRGPAARPASHSDSPAAMPGGDQALRPGVRPASSPPPGRAGAAAARPGVIGTPGRATAGPPTGRGPAAPARAAQGATPPRPAGAADARQPPLPLGEAESVPVSPIDLLRALNFPDGPDDVQAIEALRAALADHDTMRLIRAAQDVVTLLAQAGVYMDDLDPRPVPAPLWRDFAEGTRGPQMAALAGVEDEGTLDATSTLVRQDEIFRDAAHHFLRQFDRMLARLAPDLDDDYLAALAETRSGRAFVLLAQISGIFGTGGKGQARDDG